MANDEAGGAPPVDETKGKAKPKNNKQAKGPKENKGKASKAKTGGKAPAKKAVAKKAAGKKAVAKKATKASNGSTGRPAGSTNRGIGDFARDMLVKEPDVDKVLEAVHKKFPGCNTSKASIYWYRSQMNRPA